MADKDDWRLMPGDDEWHSGLVLIRRKFRAASMADHAQNQVSVTGHGAACRSIKWPLSGHSRANTRLLASLFRHYRFVEPVDPRRNEADPSKVDWTRAQVLPSAARWLGIGSQCLAPDRALDLLRPSMRARPTSKTDARLNAEKRSQGSARCRQQQSVRKEG